MKHKNKCVLITGGASGIGAAIATRFIEEGARVCIIDIDEQALANSMQTMPGVYAAILADVANPDTVDKALHQLIQKCGSIDILFNNAGISVREAFNDISIDSWNRVLAVNLTGPFIVAQRVVKLMQQFNPSKKGIIINTASVSGIVGMPNYLSYNVSKAGLIELTKTLALELAPHIRVNAICPGYVLTPMQKKEYSPAAIAACAANIPLQRLGLPEEIAALASYLASAEAEFVTGQSFIIDGGETAGGLASHSSKN